MLNKRYPILVLNLGVAGSISALMMSCGPFHSVEIDAAVVAQEAISQFDTNGNHVLEISELSKAPSLLNSLERFDSNHDQQISAEEIKARIESWQEISILSMPLSCSVTRGPPLKQAKVVLEPEAFMGTQFKSFEGITDSRGFAQFSITSDDIEAVSMGGVLFGLYKVRITKQIKGKETLPSKFNSHTTLGVEIAPDIPYARDGLRFDLR